jgi:thiosulfate/3-mercaptopyruvate sulfurtransferase
MPNMPSQSPSPVRKLLFALFSLLALATLITAWPLHLTHIRADSSADPWTAAQAVQPADFAKELASATSENKPTIVCVGFHPLFAGAHIPGASFHGSASTAAGLENLKDWAKEQPRSANVVLYCGCCPLAHCPNIRPAFLAMRDMGFTHLRVLILPNDFNTDWIAKGYPVEKPK